MSLVESPIEFVSQSNGELYDSNISESIQFQVNNF